MKFLENVGEKLKMEAKKILSPHPDQYIQKQAGLSRVGAFEDADKKALEESGEALLCFFRECCIRGNARKFRVFLDNKEVFRISMDTKCSISCEPGIHKIYVKLDSLTSQILNMKAAAGKRYCFDIACTMEDGMILRQVQDVQKKEEE